MIHSTPKQLFFSFGLLVFGLFTPIHLSKCQILENIFPTSIKSYEVGIDKITLKCDKGLIVISLYASNIIRFNYCPTYTQTKQTDWYILPSRSIVNPKVTDTKAILSIKTSDVEVRVNKTTCGIEYLDNKGKSFLTPKSFVLKPYPNENSYNCALSFIAPTEENYFGLGQLQSDWLNYRGKKVSFSPDSINLISGAKGLPFMITNRKYAILVNTTSSFSLEAGVENETKWFTENVSCVSYYIIYSPTIDGLYSGYRLLTGSAPMPSKSAFGYIQGKQRYKTQNEVLKIAQKYREKGYPCDYMILDRLPFKVKGDMDWEPKAWPNPKALNSDLLELNFNTLISCDLQVAKESKNYSLAEKNEWFIKQPDGTSLNKVLKDKPFAVVDYTNPDALSWHWNLLKENYGSKGYCNWWLTDVPGSSSLKLGQTHQSINQYAKEIYKGHRYSSNIRSLIVSPNVNIGAQQWGTIFCTPTGIADWNVYKSQIAVGLSSSVSGFPFWGTNIGGSQAIMDDTDRNKSIERILVGCDTCMPSTRKMKDYVELYVRWFQFGAFCPGFISFGNRERNEIWSYGGEAEKILVKYLKIRYKLLPYIYSQAYQSSQSGVPLMRALFMDYPMDNAAADMIDEYLFGPAFLIAPVVEQGKESRSIYLPAGNDWYDFWTYKKVKGGQHIEFSAPIDKMPILIKAGAIVPFGPEINYSLEKSSIPLEIRIYPGSDAKFVLYEDEDTNYNYEQGKCSTILFSWNDKKQTLTIGDRKGDFEGKLTERSFTVLFGNDFTKAPVTVDYAGKTVLVKMK